MNTERPETLMDKVPVLVVDRDKGIELDCSLRFNATFQLKAEGEPKAIDPATAAEIRKRVLMEIQVAYAKAWPSGMPTDVLDAGRPDDSFCEGIVARLNEVLPLYAGVSLAAFTVDSHRLGATDMVQLETLRSMKEKSDAMADADRLIVETQKRVDAARKAVKETSVPVGPAKPNEWVCPCGKTNSSRYCPECGRPRSYVKWVCSCGSINNSGQFCPECGKPLIKAFEG